MSLIHVVIIEIHVTKNKTSVVLSDFRNNILFEGSTGSVGLKGEKRSTPLYAAELIKSLAKKAYQNGFWEAVLAITKTGEVSDKYSKWVTSQNIKVLRVRHIIPDSDTDNESNV